MAKQTSRVTPQSWQVKSVWVKTRDGPERILRAYRWLLDGSSEDARRVCHEQLAYRDQCKMRVKELRP